MQDKHCFPHFAAPLIRMLPLALLVVAAVVPARADKAGDVKRAQLAKVRRIVVIPPFFGTETLDKTESKPAEAPANGEEKKSGDRKRDNNPGMDAQRVAYIGYLRKLQERAQSYLPERVATRTTFQVLSDEELTKTLKEMKKTPQSLFLNNGRIRNGKYAQPDLDAVKDLALRMEADAVLMGTLDEPRRNKGGYSFDPLCGMSYTEPDVRSRAGFFVLQADGTEILHDYIEVLHPVTKIGSRDFLLADWEEAQDLAIENLMDEWTRYTPPLPPTPRNSTAKN